MIRWLTDAGFEITDLPVFGGMLLFAGPARVG